MDDTSGFQPTQNPQPTSPASAPAEVFSVQQKPSETSLAQPANVPVSIPADSPPPPPENSPLDFIKGNIVKILVGVTVILFVLFLIFGLILPNIGKNKNEKVTLTYWGLWEDQRVMQSTISQFERQNPNIIINYSKQDPKDYRERLITRIQNGSGPDIFRFHNTWVSMFSGVLLPLPNNVISKQEFTKNYFQVANDDLIKNGAIYGIPLEIDTLSLYVNSDIIKSAGIIPPATWEEFRDDAKNLTVKDSSGKIKTAGAAIGTFDNVNHAPDILSLLFIQNGADMSHFTDSSKQVSDALRFYTSFSTDSSSVWNSTLDPSILNFSKGNVAMAFGYSWDYFNIKALNPTLNFSIVPVPQLDKNNPSNIASYWAEGASVKSKHQKEVGLFLKFLAKKEVQQQIYTEEAKTRAFGEPYSNTLLAQSLKSDPNIASFVGQANFSKSSYFVDSTNDNGINSKLNTYLGKAVDSVIGNTSPESATVTLFAGYEQILKEYGN